MNAKKFTDQEKLDFLTSSIVDDILEMSDSELSTFACDIVGDEKSAAKEFDTSVEHMVFIQNRRVLAEVETRLKAIVSIKDIEQEYSTMGNYRQVKDMIQRNQGIVDRAAHPISESKRQRPTRSPKKKHSKHQKRKTKAM